MVCSWILSAWACVPSGSDEGRAGLPPPSGASPVGTAVAHLLDGSRPDSRFPGGRPITLQLWYPAESSQGGRSFATYLMEPELADVLVQRTYYEVDADTLRSWKTLATHSRVDAEPKKGGHPLVTFSVGLGVARANYTSIAEELASHDLVVALVESPRAGVMVRPGEGVIQATGGELESAAGHREAVDGWARDVRFVLDSLAERRLGGAAAAAARNIDWKRVAALGHSSGGLVALQASASDARVLAAVNLDGGFVSPEGEPIASFVALGITKPALVLRMNPRYGPADFERRGRTREQWEQQGAAMRVVHETLAARSTAPLVFARVAGTGHFSFSDAPFVMPSTLTRFGGDLLEPRRSLLVITTAIRAFLEGVFSAHPGRLGSAAERMPELELERTTHTR